MTTQELKQQIDKVLGNSIRCLLPSYWWKRLFSLTLEKVDEKLDATNIKTINGESIVGEGNLKVGVTTVGSIDELNTLEASVGDIATVGEESAMLVSGGDLQQVDDAHEVLEKWDNLTRIVKVEFGEPVNATVYLNGKKPYAYDTIIITSIEGRFYCGYVGAGALREITIEEVNERLKKHDYRFMMGSNGDVIDRAFKLHAYSASADAYIKSYSWEKLSKEYVVSSEEELNALSVGNGTIAKVAKWQYGEVDPYQCYSITNESSHDDDTIKRIWDKLTRISHIDITYPETPPTVMPAWPTILLHGYASTSDDVIQITYYQESYKIGVGNSDSTNIVSIDKINTILQEKDYRLIDLTNDKYARPFIEEHITFYSPNANITADAYIKGETWTRLLKEGDVTGGGPEILELTLGETEEDRANNVKIYNKIVEAFNSDDIYMPMISAEGMLVSNVSLSEIEGDAASLIVIADYISFKVIFPLSLTKTGEVEVEEELQYSYYCDITSASSMVNFAKCAAAGLLHNVLYPDPRQGRVIADTFNSEGDNIVLYFNLSKGRTKVVVSSETGEILSEEVVSSGGADITIDSELSDTSENPVQNKAIKAYVDEKVANAGGGSSVDVDTELSNTSTNPVQNKVITNAINAKADNTRVDLISERLDDIDGEMKDFATESQLNNKQDVITDLDTIRQGAAKGATALQSIPSEYVTEAELNQKGYATTTQLSNKQDVISDLSTIRANADKGATALQSVPSEYVTETELSSKNFATVSQVNAKQDTISDLATIRSNAAKGATAIQQVKTINGEAIDGEGNIDVLTKDLYDNILEEMLVNEEVYAAGVNDLNSRLLETNDALNSEVASREELSEEVQALTDRVTSNEEVTATSYNELNSRIESNYQHSEEAYATKTELADEVSTINAAIVDNEEVIAATLNDLLSRIESLTTRIEQLENA